MKINLTEKYRPNSWEDFKGSEFTVDILKKMIDGEKLPNCLLFTGSRGTGKTTAARILSKELNGDSFEPMSYLEIDAASNNGVDHVRKIQDMIQYAHGGKWRIVVLDEAHALSQASFNALLKMLEEPPANTVFVLVTTKPEAIPDTVRSRAMAFRFNDIPVPDIARRLAEVIQKEKIKIKDPKVIVRIAQVAEGSLRGALVLLQQVAHVDNPDVETVNYLSGNMVDTKDLMYAMLQGDLFEFEGELGAVFNSSGDVHKVLKNLIGTLKEFHSSNLINNTQFLSCMEIVWNMRKLQLGNSDVARTQFEAGLFAMFAKNFWNGSDERPEDSASVITEKDLEAVR